MRTAPMLVVLSLVLALGCGGGSAEPEPAPVEEAPPSSGDETVERPLLTPEECEAQGGTVVGDIGDGAIHRPDYVCPSGGAPIANVPLGVEGSVCCPQ